MIPRGERPFRRNRDMRLSSGAIQKHDCGPNSLTSLGRYLPARYLSMSRWFLDIEAYIATGEGRRHPPACTCTQSRAQIDRHQQLVHATAKLLKWLAIKHTVEESSPSTEDRDIRMGLVVPARGLKEALMSDYRCRTPLLNFTYGVALPSTA